MNSVPYILIVEDCEEAVPALQIALESFFDCTVEHALNGPEAVRLLEHAQVPLAIVTDLNLPGMDGFELIQNIRTDQRCARVPIVVISADTDPATPRRARACGADAFFSKPYSPAQICHSLEKLLHAKNELVTSDPPSGTIAGPDRGAE